MRTYLCVRITISDTIRGMLKPTMSRPKPRTVADYASLFASQGGKARSRALTPKERSEAARKAVRARWSRTSRHERRAAARKAARARWSRAKKG